MTHTSTNFPLVSVLIPLYNSENYIKDTLDSCLSQTYPNIEVIVVDDGSSDCSFAIANDYAARHDNIKLFQQPNSGACRARNLAFRHSKGDYIMYLDADDIISPNKIEDQMRLLLGEPYSTVSTSAWSKFHNSIDGTPFPARPVYKDYASGMELCDDLLTDGMLLTSCWLISRKLNESAGCWNESLLINQDGEFFIRVLAYAGRVLFAPDAKVYYRTDNEFSVSKAKVSERKGLSLLQSYIETANFLASKTLLSDRARIGLVQKFQMVAYIYSKYPDIVSKAKNETAKLSPKAQPSINGGKLFVLGSKILGFWNMLKIKKLIAR